jgi:hypothetical protein
MALDLLSFGSAVDILSPITSMQEDRWANALLSMYLFMGLYALLY